MFKSVLKTIPNRFAFREGDPAPLRVDKTAIFIVASATTVAGLVWTLTYWSLFGWGLTTALPVAFVMIVSLSLLTSHLSGNHLITIYAHIFCIIYIPAFIQWSIGGAFDSGFVLLWSILGPLASLMFLSIRQSVLWFMLFILNLLITVFFDDYFTLHGSEVTQGTKLLFILMNLGGASTVVFLFAGYYVNAAVKEQDRATQLLDANLKQEMALRQSEKLATLGKLSAGIAHELNNPASATLRGADQLRATLSKLEKAMFSLGKLNMSEEQETRLETDLQKVERRINLSVDISSLSRADREHEIENWLDNNDVDEAWSLAPILVTAGFKISDLVALKDLFSSGGFSVILSVICTTYNSRKLLAELTIGSTRITEIVKALKSYSYLDQAPMQTINVHDGLNDTLVMFRSMLKSGVNIHTEFAVGLPSIEAYASELNQVWTNLIDNAISAIESKGTIVIRTRAIKTGVEVEVEDSGPGIPEDVQPKIFDPFFTTKPPGEGTGLGLSISHNIIVNKHKGTIAVNSSPNGTRFVVQLPLTLPRNLDSS